jgi:hypothetical protein
LQPLPACPPVSADRLDIMTTPDDASRPREHLATVASKWLAGPWETLRPVIRRLAELYADPIDEGAVAGRDALSGRLRSGCQCLCTLAHPGQRVCDSRPVTIITRYSELTGRVDVPVCAPCAAEDLAVTLLEL